jgi:DNA (cytosine-5)-methyltransferase 1
MRSIELFTGAGGLALGIHLAGFEHQLLIEADDDACETLLHNSKTETVSGISRWPIVHDRIESVDLSSYQKIDLLAAGIPCQPFSNGGKRCGIEDDRNMFPVFTQALATLKPEAFLLENVNGLINGKLTSHMEYIILQLRNPWNLARNGQPWKDHMEELRHITANDARKETNYKVSFQVLNAANYGVPQIRKRVFIIGFRRDLETSWNFPTATHSREVPLTNNKKAWLTVHDAIEGLPELGTEAAAAIQHVIIPGAKSYKGHTGSILDWPAKSLKAGSHGVGGGENMLRYQNGSVRYFTVRECARLQTFPDSWIFKGTWSSITRQLGNAVPIKMATVVAKSIKKALKNSVELV